VEKGRSAPAVLQISSTNPSVPQFPQESIVRGGVDPISSSPCAPWHYSLVFIIAWEMLNHGKPNTLAFVFFAFGAVCLLQFKIEVFSYVMSLTHPTWLAAMKLLSLQINTEGEHKQHHQPLLFPPSPMWRGPQSSRVLFIHPLGMGKDFLSL